MLYCIVLYCVVLCPAGTHLSGSECVNCEEGTYNDKDGQETCTDCPDDKTSPEGAYNVDQCTLRCVISTVETARSTVYLIKPPLSLVFLKLFREISTHFSYFGTQCLEES